MGSPKPKKAPMDGRDSPLGYGLSFRILVAGRCALSARSIFFLAFVGVARTCVSSRPDGDLTQLWSADCSSLERKETVMKTKTNVKAGLGSHGLSAG